MALNHLYRVGDIVYVRGSVTDIIRHAGERASSCVKLPKVTPVSKGFVAESESSNSSSRRKEGAAAPRRPAVVMRAPNKSSTALAVCLLTQFSGNDLSMYILSLVRRYIFLTGTFERTRRREETVLDQSRNDG